MSEEFRVTIARERYGDHGISGYLLIGGQPVAYTLELPWKNNGKNVSAVPVGTYHGIVRYDHRDGWRIELLDVPGGRTHVQIHTGNTAADIKGCVLVGDQISANLDKIVGGTSKPAYAKLRDAFYGTPTPNACPDKNIVVEINNGPPSSAR